MNYVIVGAGPAGVIAAETLRRMDAGANIQLIGDEPEPPYSRMAIPYCLIDRVAEEGTYLRKSDRHFDELNIEVINDRVLSVSPTDGSVALGAGTTISYDRLLVATGSTPISPPIEGMDLPGVHPCWTLADYRNIAARADKGAKVVLMGAGFIGCIILEALAARGVDLTVVELENRMVPRMMNEASGGLIKRWCEQRGVRVLTATRVEGITSGKPLAVALSNGETLIANLVISATGVAPNTQFLEGSSVDSDQGILVNERLESSVANLFAAGDVAQGRDFSTGDYTIQAIQPTAVDHGRVAASNMTSGHEQLHRGSLNMNVLDTMGLVSTSFGAWEGLSGGQSAELNDPDRFQYLNLQFHDDVLVGANTLGHTDHIGVMRGLIQTGLHLGAWKDRLLDNPLRLMEAYVAATQGVGLTAKALD